MLGNGVRTNIAERYFGQLKRSIDGIQPSDSRRHMCRYLAAYNRRYSTRKSCDAERNVTRIGTAGWRRLSYHPLASS